MADVRRVVISALALCGLAAVGCDKSVDLTFVNRTHEPLDVHLTAPEAEREYLGVLSPMGEMTHEAKIDKGELPADCAWSAGPYNGRFAVDENTDEEMRIEIGPRGGS